VRLAVHPAQPCLSANLTSQLGDAAILFSTQDSREVPTAISERAVATTKSSFQILSNSLPNQLALQVLAESYSGPQAEMGAVFLPSTLHIHLQVKLPLPLVRPADTCHAAALPASTCLGLCVPRRTNSISCRVSTKGTERKWRVIQIQWTVTPARTRNLFRDLGSAH
jgi:hypothetical protein